MPPFIPRPRRCSNASNSIATPTKQKQRQQQQRAVKAGKPETSLKSNKTFVDELNAASSDDSLSDVSSDEFEDVLPTPKAKRRKLNGDSAMDGDEEEDAVMWEDAVDSSNIPDTSAIATRAPTPSGDLELTLGKQDYSRTAAPSSDKKKGPTKIERQIRHSIHCMHVQCLLFHNLIRNAWICDTEVHRILLGHLPKQIKHEIKKWKMASGLDQIETKADPESKTVKPKSSIKKQDDRSQRDWGEPAERQERGKPNLSRGDPLFRLLEILARYWRKRFTVTAPGLRKGGYKSLQLLEEDINGWRKDPDDADQYGERVADLEEFRRLAQSCHGSRDIGSQLFTSLIRAIGIEARLVASLQPLGFGWSKAEDYVERNKAKKKAKREMIRSETIDSLEDEASSMSDNPTVAKKYTGTVQNAGKATPIKKANFVAAKKFAMKDEAQDDKEDENLVEEVAPNHPSRLRAKYDSDMPAPTYWTEAVSSIDQTVFPVDPFIVNPPIAHGREHAACFEAKGAKADKAQQVFAYIIGYSTDGTAKEVTTRYLKGHMWPGRTKGFRLPVEKIPIHNRRGKVKHYEEQDWVKRVLSGYGRHAFRRTILDDHEDATDLIVIKPEKREKPEGEGTLQGYKTSAEFVLERHLRREEALRPGAEPVRMFKNGKGDKEREEPVFRRADVEVCRTSESWHKEGRCVKAGEHALKMVPVRAVTMNRKREVEEAERSGGERLMQGMYAKNQTEWIIPAPIKDGRIPKNAYGNMDVFVPSMVPAGAIHIPLRGTMRICKKLDIDFAEAVTGFDFGHRMAVPVITGVVVAAEHETTILDQWQIDEEERRIKEEGKREKQALGYWRKWMMGLRVVQRFREEYATDPNDEDAHRKETVNPFTNKAKMRGNADSATNQTDAVQETAGDIEGGGFLPESDHEEALSGGFVLADDEDVECDFDGESKGKPADVEGDANARMKEQGKAKVRSKVNTKQPNPTDASMGRKSASGPKARRPKATLATMAMQELNSEAEQVEQTSRTREKRTRKKKPRTTQADKRELVRAETKAGKTPTRTETQKERKSSDSNKTVSSPAERTSPYFRRGRKTAPIGDGSSDLTDLDEPATE